jgi:hypothetical protein
VDVTAMAEHHTYQGIVVTPAKTAVGEEAETGNELLCDKISPHRTKGFISILDRDWQYTPGGLGREYAC